MASKPAQNQPFRVGKLSESDKRLPPPERHTRHRPAAAVSTAAPVPAREGLDHSTTKPPENSEPISLQQIMIASS